MECFVVLSDEIEGRLDSYYYKPIFKDELRILSKSEFRIAKLKEICLQISDGTHFTPKYLIKGIPFLSVKDVRENEISFDDTKFISEEEHNSLIKRCKPEPADILLTKVGTVGLAAVIPENMPDFSIFVSVALLKIDKFKANPYYVAAYLNSKYTHIQIDRFLKGIGVPDLHLENIAEIKIPIPPISLQNNIAEKIQSAYEKKKQKESEAQRLLDSIDSYVLDELGIKLPEIKIKKCFLVWNNEVVKRLDPLYYSKDVFSFLKEFSYDVKPLEGITYYLKTGFAAGNSQQEAVNEGIIQIRPTNIDDIGLLRFDKNIYLKKEYLDKKNGDLLQKGEVLFNNTNSQELVGKTSFFDLEGQYFCSNHITRIKVNEDFVSPTYLWIILNIYQKAKIFFNLCTNWNNQSGVNIELLKTVLIPLPPLEIQNKIAEEVKRQISEAERLKAEASRVIEEAKKKVEKMILGE